MIEKRIILTCGICNGEGELYGDNHIENCGYCHGAGEVEGIEKYEVEFEDEMNIGESTEGAMFPYVQDELKFIDLFDKYLEIVCNGAPMKVRIKAKKGKLVIERIEE